MKYKTDSELIQKGMTEILKSKINRLEFTMEEGIGTNVKAAFEEYGMARELAKSFLVDTLEYDDFCINKSRELKRKFGIDVK